MIIALKITRQWHEEKSQHNNNKEDRGHGITPVEQGLIEEEDEGLFPLDLNKVI